MKIRNMVVGGLLLLNIYACGFSNQDPANSSRPQILNSLETDDNGIISTRSVMDYVGKKVEFREYVDEYTPFQDFEKEDGWYLQMKVFAGMATSLEPRVLEALVENNRITERIEELKEEMQNPDMGREISYVWPYSNKDAAKIYTHILGGLVDSCQQKATYNNLIIRESMGEFYRIVVDVYQGLND